MNIGVRPIKVCPSSQEVSSEGRHDASVVRFVRLRDKQFQVDFLPLSFTIVSKS